MFGAVFVTGSHHKHSWALMPMHVTLAMLHSCWECIQDELKMDEFPIEDSMHHVPADELFDFMAGKLVAFADRIGKK